MQGTVASYDERVRAGTVLLDDGVALPFDPVAVPSDVRLLRWGQRVVVELDAAEQRVTALRIF